MGYLPSFLPTEIFVSPNGTSAFGVQSNEFMPFSTGVNVVLADGGNDSRLKSTRPQPRVLAPIDVTSIFNQNQNGGDNNQNPPCPAIYEPVCANGQTFPNACEAQKAGFTQYTQGECATNNSGDNGNGSGDNADTFPITDPETGCLIQGFDVMGNPLYIDANGNPTINPVGCVKGGNNGGGDVDNGNGGGGGGSIPDDEKIIAFVKKNWMYLLAVTAGIYLLTNKSN